MKEPLRFIPVYTGLVVIGFLAAKIASERALDTRLREATEVLKKYFDQTHQEDWKNYVTSVETILHGED